SNLVGNSFIGNSGMASGGALDVTDSTNVLLVNDTLTENSSLYGGAIANSNSTVSLINVTIYGNSSEGIGGGSLFSFVDDAVVGTTLKNTIIGGSVKGTNCQDFPDTSIVSADGNLSDDASCQGHFDKLHDKNGAAGEPLLGGLGFHGGDRQTLVPQPGSPAVDAGVSAFAPASDERGVPRPQGAAFDIGAVEVASCAGVVCGDANRSSSLTASDALIALKTAVNTLTCALWLCDYNGSGSVTASDALAILRTS